MSRIPLSLFLSFFLSFLPFFGRERETERERTHTYVCSRVSVIYTHERKYRTRIEISFKNLLFVALSSSLLDNETVKLQKTIHRESWRGAFISRIPFPRPWIITSNKLSEPCKIFAAIPAGIMNPFPHVSFLITPRLTPPFIP